MTGLGLNELLEQQGPEVEPQGIYKFIIIQLLVFSLTFWQLLLPYLEWCCWLCLSQDVAVANSLSAVIDVRKLIIWALISIHCSLCSFVLSWYVSLLWATVPFCCFLWLLVNDLSGLIPIYGNVETLRATTDLLCTVASDLLMLLVHTVCVLYSPDVWTSAASAKVHRFCSLQVLHGATERSVFQATGAGKPHSHPAAASAWLRVHYWTGQIALERLQKWFFHIIALFHFYTVFYVLSVIHHFSGIHSVWAWTYLLNGKNGNVKTLHIFVKFEGNED